MALRNQVIVIKFREEWPEEHIPQLNESVIKNLVGTDRVYTRSLNFVGPLPNLDSVNWELTNAHPLNQPEDDMPQLTESKF